VTLVIQRQRLLLLASLLAKVLPSLAHLPPPMSRENLAQPANSQHSNTHAQPQSDIAVGPPLAHATHVPLVRSYSHPVTFLPEQLGQGLGLVSEDDSDDERERESPMDMRASGGSFYGGSTSPHWRRERLLRIGTSSSNPIDGTRIGSGDAGVTGEVDGGEGTGLLPPNPSSSSFPSRFGRNYGTMNTGGGTRDNRNSRFFATLSPRASRYTFRRNSGAGDASDPVPRRLLQRTSSFFRKPVAYDAPLPSEVGKTGMGDGDGEINEAVKANGIRVW